MDVDGFEPPRPLRVQDLQSRAIDRYAIHPKNNRIAFVARQPKSLAKKFAVTILKLEVRVRFELTVVLVCNQLPWTTRPPHHITYTGTPDRIRTCDMR